MHTKQVLAEAQWERTRVLGACLQMLQIFEEKPLESLGTDKDIVFIEVNRGRSVKLSKNPHHKAQVRV